MQLSTGQEQSQDLVLFFFKWWEILIFTGEAKQSLKYCRSGKKIILCRIHIHAFVENLHIYFYIAKIIYFYFENFNHNDKKCVGQKN